MRLFVAADIGDLIADRSTTLIHQLQQRANALAPGVRVTWLTRERLHITVRFIGEVDEARGRAVADALGPQLTEGPFTLIVEGTGAFPKKGRPRALWAGVTEGQDQLIAIEKEVTRRLARIGIPHEVRDYSPHLTLARVRDAAGLRAEHLLEGCRDLRLGATRIDAITLFQSTLSSNGPTYVPLLRTPLGRP